MPCDQHLLVQRLTVEDPASLSRQPWAAHMAACADCRRERYTLERSLAVFRQLDALPPPAGFGGPSWETFSHALAHTRRRGRWVSGPRWRAPLAAASLLAVVSTGVVVWQASESPSAPHPARIVKLQPDQEVHLQRVLQTSLGDPAPLTGSRAARESSSRALSPGGSDAARFAIRDAPPQGVPIANGARVAEAPMRVRSDTHPSTRSREAQPTRAPSATQVAAASPATETTGSIFRADDRPLHPNAERAPVIIFRSLQQRGNSSPPVRVLPVGSPQPGESATTFIRSLFSPRPIR